MDRSASRLQATSDEEAAGADNPEEVSAGSDDMVSKLKARDKDVVAHEAAHMAAGGAYVRGAASYTYQVGPDGKSYAIGGEVGVDVSAIPGDPHGTIEKMRAIQAAANSPDDPSGQDLAIASAAAKIEAAAQAQLDREAKAIVAPPTKRPPVEVYKRGAARHGNFVNATA